MHIMLLCIIGHYTSALPGTPPAPTVTVTVPIWGWFSADAASLDSDAVTVPFTMDMQLTFTNLAGTLWSFLSMILDY